MNRIKPVIAALLLFSAGCSKGPDADLQYISQARSIAAEWALINELDGQGRLNRTYVDSMHHWFAKGLGGAQSSLRRPDTDYGAEIRALAAEPPATSAAVLRARAMRLKRIEDELESA